MRALITLFTLGFTLALYFLGTMLAYAVGSWVDGFFGGAHHLTNIVVQLVLFVMVTATVLTLIERKWSALMQDRIGPNRARLPIPGLARRALSGLPHIPADVLKMLTKEDFRPAAANTLLFNLGPMLAFGPAMALFAVVPAGPDLMLWGRRVSMVIAAPDFGVLYVFAIASLAVYGTSLAGWASNNKLALLGGVRASSQMISYEVALGLSLVGVMLAFSTVQLSGATGIVESQAGYLWRFSDGSFDVGLPRWGLFVQPLGFVLFFAAAMAETKRAPFDVPEGDSEIVGYFVEYSGMKFGLFMVSEFVEVVVLAGVLTALFLGGYHLPFGDEWLRAQLANSPLWLGATYGMIFWAKVLIMIWLQMAVRWSFPRFRYDQIQSLGWKILLPVGLVNVFVTGALVLWDPSLRAAGLVGLLELGVLVALSMSSKSEGEAHAAHGAHDAHGAAHGAPAAHH